MNFRKYSAVLLLIAAVVTGAVAQKNLFGLKVSTMGISLDAARAFGNTFNVRVGGAWFTIPAEFEADDFNFEGDLQLLSFSTMADWFPLKGAFRLTGGAYLNLNKGNIKLSPINEQVIGGITYSKNDMGSVEGDVKFNIVSPYAGIGFGNAGTGKGLAFLMDFGVIYHGKPQVSLSSGPVLEPTAAQAGLMQSNLEWAQWYPVLALGIAYRL